MDKVMVAFFILIGIVFTIVLVTMAIVMFNMFHEQYDTIASLMITSFVFLIILTFMGGVIAGLL